MQTSERSYRCHYTPLDRDGFPVTHESGVQPFIQLKARDAEAAQRSAHALTGCPISEVQRLDPTDSVFAVLSAAHDRAQAARFAA